MRKDGNRLHRENHVLETDDLLDMKGKGENSSQREGGVGYDQVWKNCRPDRTGSEAEAGCNPKNLGKKNARERGNWS